MCTHAAFCQVCVYTENESSGFLHLNICTSTGLNLCLSALLHPCPETTPKLLDPTGAGTFWLSCCWESSGSQGTGKWLFSHQINPKPLSQPILAHGNLALEQVCVHSLEGRAVPAPTVAPRSSNPLSCFQICKPWETSAGVYWE